MFGVPVFLLITCGGRTSQEPSFAAAGGSSASSSSAGSSGGQGGSTSSGGSVFTGSSSSSGGGTLTGSGSSGASSGSSGGSNYEDGGRPHGPTRQAGTCPLIPPSDAGSVPVCVQNPTTCCTLVGLWALNSSHGIVQTMGVIEFNADGSYYGGPVGSDFSQTYAYDGAYRVSPGGIDWGPMFDLIYSCGDGCNGNGTFDLQFQNGCATAILTERTTACTGNRVAVAGNVVLIRQ